MILYKYLSPERIDVLVNCKIRYSQPGALNDPFEVRPSFDKIASKDEAINTFEQQLPVVLREEYQKLPRDMRRKVSFEDFYRQAKSRMTNTIPDFLQMVDKATPILRSGLTEALHNNIGILSLTQTPVNLLMWSHYADSHRGFVVGFESTHPYFNQRRSETDEFGYLRKVEYRDRGPSKPMIELEGNDIFLVKGREWEYEEEWRVLKSLREADEVKNIDPYPIHLYKFPNDVISEVILGCKMPDPKKDEIISLVSLEFTGVKIFTAEIDPTNNTLNLSRIL